jgi:hypothetical protein
MNHKIKLVALVTFCAFSGFATAQTPPPAKPLSTSLGVVVFPAKGQTPQQQSQDEGECFTWSKTQTGFDPMNPTANAPATPPPTAAAPPQQGGERVRGAARGAAAGAIIGEVADDDASRGAEVGAAVGVLKGGAERRQNQAQAQQQAAQQQQQSAANQQAAVDQQSALFKNGFQVCLESKGYTVK